MFSDQDHFYDIIGDVHGYADKLQILLKGLGYYKNDGVWMHDSATAIFVGDFIDRGPSSKKVIKIIKKMIKAGSAEAILGNHEVNAILYFTCNKKGNAIKQPLATRKVYLDKFRKEYKNTKKFQKHIKWLRTLPLFLEKDDFRVVHAYWNDKNIDKLRNLHTNGKLKRKTLKLISDQDSDIFRPFWETVKGLEIQLPKNIVLKNSKDNRVTNFKIKWWIHSKNETAQTNADSISGHSFKKNHFPKFEFYPEDAPFIFFGHYCLIKGPFIFNPNICCTDACVAGHGKLAVYRQNKNSGLSKKNLYLF